MSTQEFTHDKYFKIDPELHLIFRSAPDAAAAPPYRRENSGWYRP